MSNVSVGNIQGTATLDASQFTAGANQAVGALQQLELATAANWWGLRNLGAALAAIPAAVSAGVGASVGAYMEWEDAIAGVERTTYRAQEANESAAEAQERNARTLNNIVSGLREIAKNTPISAAGLAGIAEAAGALGIAESDITSFTQVVADLAATTDLSENSAATNLARIAGLTGVTGQGFDNLASSILEVGRSTAATEQEIVDVANRIAGVAGVAQFSAAEVIAFAGALRTAGVRSEQGGTAFQKTVNDIIVAVSRGGDELQQFAAISNMTADEFRQSWQADSADTFAEFITGLGQLIASGENVISLLNSMGITEQRQIQTLLLLARAQNQTANESLKLTSALDTSREAFIEGSALADVAQKRYKTLSSQIQLLRNDIFFASQAFGSTFAPVLGFIIERLRDFIAGVSALPEPLKIVVGVVIAVSTAFLALASAAILLGPRLVIAMNAIRQLQGQTTGAVGGLSSLSGGMVFAGRQATIMANQVNAATGSINRMNIAAINNNLANFGKGMQAGAGAASAYTARTAQAATATAGLSVWVARLGKGLGWLGVALTIGSVLMTLWGGSIRESSSALTDHVEANRQLFDVLSNNGNVIDDNVRAWMRQNELWPKIEAGVGKYGQTLSEVQAIIEGSASNDEYKAFLDATNKAYQDGDKDARTYADAVITIARTLAETRKEYASMTGPIQDVIDAQNQLSESFNTEKEVQEANELRRALEAMANATVDYVEALRAQARSNFEVIDAQEAYNEALANAQDPSRVLIGLERDLAAARRRQQRAQDALAEAEENVATARERQQRELKDALNDLVDANEAYEDAQRSLLKAEEELAELRQGPSLKEIIKATNDLADAHLRLARAEQGVMDAEWYLQYLREEGASERDIREAELALQEARNEQSNATEDVAESEEELARARQGASPEELAEAEERYEDALRNTERAYDRIIDREQEVARIRNEIANDTAYIEAVLDLEDARDAMADATDRVADAERELNNMRDSGIARALAEAELDLTDALYNQAKANAEARIAQMRMNGIYVDAGTEAAILAEELGKLVGLAPTASQQRRLREFIELLKSAPESGPEVKLDTIGSFEGLDFGAIAIAPPDLNEFASAFDDFANSIPAATMPSWSQLWSQYGTELAITAGILIASAIGAAFLGVPAAALAAVGFAAWLLIKNFGDDIVNFFTEIVGPAIANFFTKTLPNFFTESVPNAVKKIPTVMISLGKSIIDSLISGIQAVLNSKFKLVFLGLPGLILSFVPDAAEWLWDVGWDIIVGLINGIYGIVNNLWEFFLNMPGNIINLFGDAAKILWNVGYDIIRGLFDGIGYIITSFWKFFQDMPGNIVNMFPNAIKILWNVGYDIIKGLFDGIWSIQGSVWEWFGSLPGYVVDLFGDAGRILYDVGWDIIQGLWDGMWDLFWAVPGSVANWLGSLAGSIISLKGPPSYDAKILIENGGLIMQGLLDGMKRGWNDVESYLTTRASALSDQFANSTNSIASQFAAADNLRFSAATGSGAFAGTGTQTAQTIIYEGDTNIEVEAHTDADPLEIAGEIMWQNNFRKR